jgi:RNA polymerase sigma-70 factor (ECF subfamily)
MLVQRDVGGGVSESLSMLQRARSGDEVAIGTLLKGYARYLTLIAQIQIGKRLQAKVDADDLVQDVFLEAHRQFGNFRGTTEAELTAWLRRILAGQIAGVFRRYLGTRGRNATLERDLALQLDESSRMLDRGLVGSGTSPSQSVSRREQAVLLAEALDRLPADYRAVIVHRHIEQLSFAEVAARMQRSEDSVQKLWMRAIKSLRAGMEGNP